MTKYAKTNEIYVLPLAVSFLVLNILAAYSICDSLCTHLFTILKAPLEDSLFFRKKLGQISRRKTGNFYNNILLLLDIMK